MAIDSSAQTVGIKRKQENSTNHPSYVDMVLSAIESLGNKTGSSRVAITKFITENWPVNDKVALVHVKIGINKAIENNLIVRYKEKGLGVNGSFKLAPKVVKSFRELKIASKESDKEKPADNPKMKISAVKETEVNTAVLVKPKDKGVTKKKAPLTSKSVSPTTKKSALAAKPKKEAVSVKPIKKSASAKEVPTANDNKDAEIAKLKKDFKASAQKKVLSEANEGGSGGAPHAKKNKPASKISKKESSKPSAAQTKKSKTKPED